MPDGAWSGSPAAQAYAAERGASSGSSAIGAAFMAEIIELVAATTGRRVGVWQEAAESGALRPGDGYVVGWKSAADCRRLAAAGHTVVAAPAEVYYLDMAADDDWDVARHELGRSLVGRRHRGLRPGRPGGRATSGPRLAGIQACLWTEHVPDRPTLERLLFPRLDAIAAAAWQTRF